MLHLCNINVTFMKQENFMKFIFVIVAFFSVINLTASTLFESAKTMLSADAEEIEVTYNNEKVTSICPIGSVGCYVKDKSSNIYVLDTLNKDHHDVVIFGLFSDYLQLVNNGFIDPSLTCDMKVRFLKSNNENYLANLYKGYCDTQFKGKVLVLN